MKTLLNSKKLPLLALVLGLVGLGLRKGLYAVALDQKNLLVSHPLGFALGAVTVAAIALIAAGVLRWNHGPLEPLWKDTWHLNNLLMALGVATTALESGFADSRLILARNVLALLSAAALLAVMVLRNKKTEPPFLLYGIVCIFFAVHMVSCYQGWSSNPQIQDYLFTLLAGVGMMLYAYQRTAAAVGFRKEKQMLAIGLLAGIFCIVALSGTSNPLLYLCGGCWVLTDLTEVVSGE